MRERWLNAVIYLTNRVYQRKKGIVTQAGVQTILSVIYLIVLEVGLALLSLPLYVGVKPATVTAYIEGKGRTGK